MKYRQRNVCENLPANKQAPLCPKCGRRHINREDVVDDYQEEIDREPSYDD